jgi:hypothetical protein
LYDGIPDQISQTFFGISIWTIPVSPKQLIQVNTPVTGAIISKLSDIYWEKTSPLPSTG